MQFEGHVVGVGVGAGAGGEAHPGLPATGVSPLSHTVQLSLVHYRQSAPYEEKQVRQWNKSFK